MFWSIDTTVSLAKRNMFFASINQETTCKNAVISDAEIFPNSRQWAAVVRNKCCILLSKVRYTMAISIENFGELLSIFL